MATRENEFDELASLGDDLDELEVSTELEDEIRVLSGQAEAEEEDDDEDDVDEEEEKAWEEIFA